MWTAIIKWGRFKKEIEMDNPTPYIQNYIGGTRFKIKRIDNENRIAYYKYDSG